MPDQETPKPPDRCELGREEYGGDRYCFRHGGFVHLGSTDHRCDKHRTNQETQP